ncbi:ATP-binding protein [Streptomyces sp. NBC_00691]|uniref:ATP-binding protein n=1 Tax=Streptomyces sp. NBC_00691 TaxID=2903671 RepID=UPI002E3099B0|nr:ATP-binding protein [Streptomyces sp. NBC_00691]
MRRPDDTDRGAQLGEAGAYLHSAGYELDGDDLSCIAEARRHAAAFLAVAGTVHGLPIPQRVYDLTALVVSELVTNAHKYAPGPVHMELRIHAGSVEVSVCDRRPAVPAVRGADPGRIGQHGMEIIQAITEKLSTEQLEGGKRITARLSLGDDTPAVRG